VYLLGLTARPTGLWMTELIPTCQLLRISVWMALMRVVVWAGLERILRRMRQFFSLAFARSPGARMSEPGSTDLFSVVRSD